ncbi:MAG: hypothetical protein K2X07_07810 [Caulobacteraceae bacterium]|nr:hypothetical protein [Caulobacteraceae bacterium]
MTAFIIAIALAVGVQQPSLIGVKSDDGRRAVFERQFGGTLDIPHIGGAIYLAPKRAWPRQRNYDIWVVRFDCMARTRTTTARITYSSWRDPQNVPTTPHRIDGETNPAVAEQLALVCDRQSGGRATYRTLDDFLENHPLP